MIIGLIVFALYLYFSVGFNQIFIVVKNVDLSGYFTFYLLAIGVMLFVMLCWVSSWRGLLKALGVRISLKNAYLYYWTGFFVDLIVPCQQICGEVTRLYLVQKDTKQNYGAIGAAGIANRLVVYSIVTAGLTAGVFYLLIRNMVPAFAQTILVLSWVGALAYLTVLLSLALKANAADKIANAIFKLLNALRIKRYRTQTGLSPDLVASLKSFHEGFEFFRGHPRHLVRPIFLQLTAYILNLLIYVLIFYSLGFRGLIFDFFILIYFLAGAVQDATSAFSVGGLEILLTNVFIFFGIPAASSGVAAAVLRSVTFWFPLVVGYIIVQVVGAKKLLVPEERHRIEAEEQREIRESETA